MPIAPQPCCLLQLAIFDDVGSRGLEVESKERLEMCHNSCFPNIKKFVISEPLYETNQSVEES